MNSALVRNRHLFFSDCVLLPSFVYFSYVLRLDSFDLHGYWVSCAVLAGLALVLGPLVFYEVGIYSRYWPYMSIEEGLLLLWAVVLLIALIEICLTAGERVLRNASPHPHSVLVIFLLLALAASVGPRTLQRLLPVARIARPNRRAPAPTTENVVVIGAGDAGALVVRQLRRNPQLGLRVVGLLDDDPARRDLRIHGVPVLGGQEDLATVAARYDVRRALIAMHVPAGRPMRDLVARCASAAVRPQLVPGVPALLDGTISVSQLRDVEVEDLLRRQPISTDLSAMGALLQGKRVLITGAGGSIGGELARQVLRQRPAQMVLLGHGENSVFEIHNELRCLLDAEEGGDRPTTTLVPLIADVRSGRRIRALFEQHRPDVVFHAAAHKHVPLMEANLAEAITNNILGTRNVLRAALAVGVAHFVLISTDKAVNPTSIMGASKRVAELLVHQAFHTSGKAFMVVRFGNVLGSRGSVVLTMKRQIAAGGPVTVTHPEITRFFMTIPEAVQLVLQATVLGRGGEVFVFDMGQPIRIIDLARDLIRLSGLEAGRDIDIVYSGLRPGEKLYEELFIAGERYSTTRHRQIFIADNASGFVPPQLDDAVAALEMAARSDDDTAIVAALRRLVPEFAPDRGAVAKPVAPAREAVAPPIILALPLPGPLVRADGPADAAWQVGN